MENNKETELNYQIGLLIGEKIVENDLLTLSTDMLKTKNIIDVPEDLAKEWKIRDDIWIDFKGEKSKSERTKVFYENLSWYKENIEKPFLPEIIECQYGFVYTDEKAFIDGLELAIWDCDLSHYVFDKIESSSNYWNKITLSYE